MRDPRRITEVNQGEMESDLIAAMREDRPTSRARERTLATLGLGSATLGVSSSTIAGLASKVAAVSTWVAVGKWVALGVGGGVLTLGLLYERPERPARVAAPGPRPSVEIVTPVEARVARAEQEAPPSPAGPVASAPSASKTIVARAPKQDLTEEIAMLDLARKASLAHEPHRALELLSAYHQRFLRGVLVPEARVLRVEALAASGQKSAAIALARECLAASPTGPHAERLQAIVSGDFAP